MGFFFCSILVPRGRLGGKKKSFWFVDHQRTTAPHPTRLYLFWWAMMKAQVGARKLPSLVGSRLLICGFLLAQEWRFAVWLLGTVGQCSQSSVCSLACRAPRVSLAPEGETNKKAPLSRTLKWSPTHSSFLLNGGAFLFLGEEWQKETSSLETGCKDNKTAVVWTSFP